MTLKAVFGENPYTEELTWGQSNGGGLNKMAAERKECSKKVEIVFEKRTHEENNPFSRAAQMLLPLRGCNSKKIKKAFTFEPGFYYLGQSKPGVRLKCT
ncbi:hypothetical protein B5X24_HaOG202397 [Helicoverpa armigera]|nr:hypothetical protein B5X24_HaOG202397 [Helicoverpa armigera]